MDRLLWPETAKAAVLTTTSAVQLCLKLTWGQAAKHCPGAGIHRQPLQYLVVEEDPGAELQTLGGFASGSFATTE